MSTRHAGYLGAGILVGVIALGALQAPPLVWLLAIAAAVGAGLYLVVRAARATGVDLAHEILARMAPDPAPGHAPAPVTMPVAPTTPVADHAADTAAAPSARLGPEVDVAGTAGEPVDVTLVRAADADRGAVAVWLHRCGGRRVHRYAADGEWIVEQVSTKDPDNPRKRVIGRSRTFASEDEAARAADDLARGILPEDVAAARALGVPPATAAEARRRRVKLTGQAQARRLADEWGMLARA